MSIQVASKLEQRIAESINAEREAEGLPGLKLEVHLNASSQAHSDWMAETGTFSHTGEGGSTSGERIAETGFELSGSWRTAENLAYTSLQGGLGADEADKMHDGLMGSAGHRANILNPDLEYVGIGLSVGKINVGGVNHEVVFLTQNFAATDGEVLVQQEEDGETVLQPWQNGQPVGKPEQPGEEDEREDDEGSGGGGGGCFVATAAYGDALHPDVRALRCWRDKHLVRHAAGRAFIRAYWIIGPRLARVVAHDRASGRVSRALLAPIARMAGRWVDRGRG